MATRCLIVIMMFTFLLLLPISCVNVPNPTPTPTTTLTYENSAYGVKINYPQDWTKQEFTSGQFSVHFTRPMESATDIPSEEVIIIVLDFSAQPMTLDEYTQVQIQRLGQLVPDSKIIDSTPTTLAGYPAQRMVYTMKIGQSDIKELNVYTIKNNKAYIISYLAQSSRYSDFLGIAQQMIDSFEITSSTGQ
jgi:eukaryotic-like serine/threonine-protein kinase